MAKSDKGITMKILVTGHEGFIGQNMMKHLADLDHDVEGYEWNDGVLPEVKGFDCVIHLGAISATTERDVEKIMTQNYEFSYRLLMLCNEHGVDMHYASSASVYGNAEQDTELGYSEECPLAPQSPYAWSKYLFDRLVLKSLDRLSIKVYGFRYFNVYGPHEEHKGFQASLYSKWTKNKGPHDLFDVSGEVLRDFVHVEDLCKIHSIFLESPHIESGIYNLAAGNPTNVGRLAALMGSSAGVEFNTVPMPEELKSQYQFSTRANVVKLQMALGHYTFRDIERVSTGL